ACVRHAASVRSEPGSNSQVDQAIHPHKHEQTHQRKTVPSTRASVLTLAQDAQVDHLIENRQTT
ncbi:hypothetical protein, partial [Nisaea sp.]|uniref:hypothetical protein n=1 Tax=Nisaea sp. TaxID=2024842 RepID=UPI0025CE1A99